MTKLIEAAKRLRDAIKEMDACIKDEKQTSGVYSWNYASWEKPIELQMELMSFMREFGRGELIERSTEEYPYQVEAERDGIVYFALMDQDEYQTYMEADNEEDKNTGLHSEIA